MKEIIFLNGKFVCPEDATVSALSPGFLSGYGVFETMRSIDKRIVYFDRHIERIKSSCGLVRVRFPYSEAAIKKAINKALSLTGFRDNYIRLTLWKKEALTGILIVARQYRPYSREKYASGFRCCISQFKQIESSALSRAKTTSRILYELALGQAKDKDFDEAVIFNNRGFICEGARTNIFFVKDKEIFTPALECGCLDGITRKAVLDLALRYKLKCYDGKFTLFDLLKADEAFLTNSLIGVMPLASVENKTIGKGKSRPLTKFLIKKYNCLLGKE